MNIQQKPWYSAKETAEMSQLPLPFVIQLCEDGKLTSLAATGFEPYVSSEALVDVLQIPNGKDEIAEDEITEDEITEDEIFNPPDDEENATQNNFYEMIKNLPHIKNIYVQKVGFRIRVSVYGVTRTKRVMGVDENMSAKELQAWLENKRDEFIAEQTAFLKNAPMPIFQPTIFEPELKVANVFHDYRFPNDEYRINKWYSRLN